MKFLSLLEKVIRVKEKDKVSSVILLILSIVGIMLGSLILLSQLKISNAFVLNGDLMAWILIIFGIISFVYSILSIIIIFYKSKNKTS